MQPPPCAESVGCEIRNLPSNNVLAFVSYGFRYVSMFNHVWALTRGALIQTERQRSSFAIVQCSPLPPQHHHHPQIVYKVSFRTRSFIQNLFWLEPLVCLRHCAVYPFRVRQHGMRHSHRRRGLAPRGVKPRRMYGVRESSRARR